MAQAAIWAARLQRYLYLTRRLVCQNNIYETLTPHGFLVRSRPPCCAGQAVWRAQGGRIRRLAAPYFTVKSRILQVSDGQTLAQTARLRCTNAVFADCKRAVCDAYMGCLRSESGRVVNQKGRGQCRNMAFSGKEGADLECGKAALSGCISPRCVPGSVGFPTSAGRLRSAQCPSRRGKRAWPATGHGCLSRETGREPPRKRPPHRAQTTAT